MNWRLRAVAPIILVATSLSGQQAGIQDPAQLPGKRVIVGRMTPLCEPGTWNATVAYAGKEATVVSAKPKKGWGGAADIVLQFADGKTLQTCVPLVPKLLADNFELAPGETLPPAATGAVNRPAAEDALSNEEVKSALAGTGRDHHVRIMDMGFTTPGAYIELYLPEALIAERSEVAKKQFLSYEPTAEDRERALTVVAQGYVGHTIQSGCDSVTRVVLLSSESGGVVEEAYSNGGTVDTYANAYGATIGCQWMKVKFSMSAVKRVQAAAKEGEFYIAVFAGSAKLKTYKIKHKHLATLGLK